MENEKLIQEFIKRFTGQERLEVERFLKTLTENGVRFSEAIRRANSEFASTDITVKDLANSIDGILSSLGRQNRIVSEGTKSFKKLESIVRRIQDDQAGIYDLSLKELKATKAKAASELNRLASISEGLLRRATAGEELGQRELELLLLSENQFENQKAILEVLDKRIEKEKSLESALGITGAVLENLNKIGIRALGGIGVNLGTLQDAFDEAREAGRNAALEIEALSDPERFDPFSKRVATLFASVESVGKGIGEALNDPLTLGLGLITKIIDQVTALNTAQNEVRRLTGQTVFGFNGILGSVGEVNARAATTVDILNTIAEVTNQIGVSAIAIFNKEQLIAIAEAKELVGLTADEATRLALVSKLTGESVDKFENAILRGADASNEFFKSAIAPKVALQEALRASTDIVLSLGMAPAKLGAAATAAKALGLELSKVDSIAENLLDFESSIQNELEAQLITGRNINLSRAREFALTNDLVGLTEEIGKNVVTAAEFAEMNRIQQASLAKSLGLSRQELAEIVLQTSLNNSLTDKQRASVLGVTEAQLENLDATKSIEKSVQAITQAFAPLLENVVDLLEKTNAIKSVITVGFGLAITKFTVGLAAGTLQLVESIKKAKELKRELIQAAVASKSIGTGLVDVKGREITTTPTAPVATAAGKTIGKKLLRALPYIGLAYAAVDILKSIGTGDDMVSLPSNKGGYGDRLLFDRGTITSLNNKDTVVAGTNLGGGNNNRRTEQLLERLVTAVEKGGNVYIDGNKAGEALVLGTYKSS